MRIVWDEPKRLVNIARHGMDFADLDFGFFGRAILRQSHSGRWLASGSSDYGLISVVFTRLGSEAISGSACGRQVAGERRLANG